MHIHVWLALIHGCARMLMGGERRRGTLRRSCTKSTTLDEIALGGFTKSMAMLEEAPASSTFTGYKYFLLLTVW